MSVHINLCVSGKQYWLYADYYKNARDDTEHEYFDWDEVQENDVLTCYNAHLVTEPSPPLLFEMARTISVTFTKQSGMLVPSRLELYDERAKLLQIIGLVGALMPHVNVKEES